MSASSSFSTVFVNPQPDTDVSLLFREGPTPFPHPEKSPIAVFLDRDGTLNEERGYIKNLPDLELIAGAAKAVKRLNEAGLLTILTTNQTGAARGYYPESHIWALNTRVLHLLQVEAGAYLDAVFYSPYYEKGNIAPFNKASDCRKPGLGMLEKARQLFPAIDWKRSYVLGDKATDVEFGINAGAKAILLKTGYGQQVLAGTYQELKQQPWRVCDSIVDAVDSILAEEGLLKEAKVVVG